MIKQDNYIFTLRLRTLVLVCSIVFSLSSCRVPYEQPRINSVKIESHSGKFSESEVSDYIRQKPNKKILFIIPFHLTVHNLASQLKDRSADKSARIDKKIKNLQSKNKAVDFIKMEKKRNRTFRGWLMETIGEAPVLYDSMLTAHSEKQIELYLKSTGHFNAQVESELKPNRNNRRARVIYHISGGTPHTIGKFTWETSDERLRSYMNDLMKESLISEGMQYNEDIFDNERDRISGVLRNSGYYHFSKSFIAYNADTTVGNFITNLQLIVKPFIFRSEDPSVIHRETQHPRSRIGNIYFNLDFKHDGSNLKDLDTTIVEFRQRKTDTIFRTYYFLHDGPIKYKPKTLLKKNFLKTGENVRIINAVRTNTGLASLGNFKYINIRFLEREKDSINDFIMDANIDLTRIQKQTVTTEIEGTNSSGKLGISANISYKNRNTFKGAESLNLKLRGAIEAQTLISPEIEEDNIIESLPFNTIESGFEAELILPRFLMPYNERFFTERNAPKTVFTAGGLFQQRPDYTRYIGNLSLTYDWRETAQRQHLVTPIFINLVRIFPDSMFSARIEQFSRPLQTSYKDHFISGIRWTYTYTSKSIAKSRNYMLFRSNIENAGLFPFIFSRLFAGAEAGQTYYLLGIRFAQYTKGDFDIRQYFNLTEKSSFVIRYFTGIGIPYGNIDVLPFDKRYSAGGSNDIRAWKYRSLGPGSYSDQVRFDKTGDISLILNLEYRFPVYKILQSAIFIDAGNIWMLKEYADYPGGTFKINEFYKQIAVGTGLGLRLNFGFFIFRLDAGFPIHDPALPEGERWPGFTNIANRTNLNFGIGYPF